MKVIRSGRLSITAVFADGETPTDVDDTVDVTVVNDEGTETQTGTASNVGTGTYAFTLSGASTAELDRLTVTWTAEIGSDPITVTTYADVVGGFHATLAQIRNYGPGPDLPDHKYTDAAIVEARDTWESIAEDYCSRAFVPRYQRVTVRTPSRRGQITTPFQVRTVRWATADGVAADISEWTIGNGVLYTGPQAGPLIVGLEHGLDACPADVTDAAIRWCRTKLRETRTAVDAPRTISPDGSVEMRESYQSATQDKRADNVLGRYRAPAVA